MLDSKTSNGSKFFFNLLSAPLIWTLFAVSMLLTLALSYRFHQERENISLQHFNDASTQLLMVLKKQFVDHQEILQSSVAYYNSSKYILPEEWDMYVAQMYLSQTYPAIKAMKLLRLNAQDTAQERKNSQIAIAMDNALIRGKATISISQTNTQEFYIAIPLYKQHQPKGTLQHEGWVLGIIDTRAMITPLLGSRTRNLAFTISDSQKHSIFSTLRTLSKHKQTSVLSILGVNLRVDIFSTPVSMAKINLDISPYVFIAGTVLNVFLLMILLSFNKNRILLEAKNRELDMLNTLIGESNDMVFIIRIDNGYVEYINQTATKLLGYTLDEIRSVGIDSFRRPLKKDDTFNEHLQELKKSGRLIDYAFITRKDGSEFPIEANVRLVRYNEVDYNIALVRDISENELYNEKLSYITQHLNEAQKIAKLGSWCLKLTTGELEWSDEIYELFEIDKATHNPSYDGFLDAIHPDDRELVNKAYHDSVEHHTSYNYVHRLLMKDGRVKYAREQGENFYTEDGTPTESRGTVHDITEEILLQQDLKLKNDALIEASARLELATRAAGIGIWVWNIQDNTILWDNRMFIIYLNEDSPQSMYVTYDVWKNACHPDDAARAEEELMYAVQNGTPFQTKFKIIQPNGEVRNIYASSIIKNDSYGNAHYMIGINRDITNEVQMEEKLIISKEAAERANKVKSDFLANMSHEIRTPLNGVIGLTELLLQTELHPLQREYLHKSETASHALLNVLNNILDYSKIEAHKLILEATTFNLDDILSNLQAMISYKAEQKHLLLETHIDDNVPRILIGDPLRLQQILSNLMVNALKFTEQGFVRLSITSTSQENKLKLTFDISDSGIGMSSQEQAALFQPFSQVDTSFTRKYGGSGLGLMITKELVDLMGGEINVYSVSGEGSTFTFTALFEYTIADESSEHVTHQEILPLPHNKPLHLLLVEDNDLNQLVASEHLKQMGITCAIANNGLEAIEMVQQETFDAILMDLQMPVMDGLEATREIRKLESMANIPIIALSAAVLQDDLKQALEAGMNDFVAKPIDKIVLQNILSKWLSI